MQERLPFTPAIGALISECVVGRPPADYPVCPDSHGAALGADDLAALLACAAHDAGLLIRLKLRPRYCVIPIIAYLVRQGVRLSDLETVAGDMPPSVLAAYAAFSPPGSGSLTGFRGTYYPALIKLS